MKPSSGSTMVIRTETYDEVIAGLRRNAQMLDHGEHISSYNGISFTESSTMLHYFPARRVKLLDALARHGAMPVSELASRVQRVQVAVERDLLVLEGLGTIRLRPSRKADASKIAEPVAARYEIVYTLGPISVTTAKRRLRRAS